ncbi:MAG: hypothetical protein JJU24_05255 [Natronohydrobacter sp.]|nr:hypothetical protein [Natronohydrobacter sp.]
MPAGTRIPAARIRRLWLDERLSTVEAAAQAGLSRSSLWLRAKALGLPPRKLGRKYEIADIALFTAMWKAGVHGPAMAVHFGVTYSAIRATARRHGLPPRLLGTRPKVTLVDFLQTQLAARMAPAARDENARLREMHREVA